MIFASLILVIVCAQLEKGMVSRLNLKKVQVVHSRKQLIIMVLISSYFFERDYIRFEANGCSLSFMIVHSLQTNMDIV